MVDVSEPEIDPSWWRDAVNADRPHAVDLAADP